MRVHLTPISRNTKTGPIPVSTTSSDTCPDSCPFKGHGCYAQSGPLNLHWRAVDRERGDTWQDFLVKIRRLPRYQLWRHNQAGDLPGQGDTIDGCMLDDLVKANKTRNGFTYTHKPMTPDNLREVVDANAAGFTINVSANNLAHADEMKDLDPALPVVAVVSEAAPRHGLTPAGRRYIVCPAQLDDDMNCARCGLCQRREPQRPIIAFRAHGSGKRKIEALLMGAA